MIQVLIGKPLSLKVTHGRDVVDDIEVTWDEPRLNRKRRFLDNIFAR